MLRCPNDSGASTSTSYVAVVGPETIWPGVERRRFDIKDGVSRTISVVEVASSGIHWMEPRDLEFDDIGRMTGMATSTGVSSNHPGNRALVAFCDGHSHIILTKIRPDTLKALLTVDGGEDIDLDSDDW